jgi:predicted GIY-YIG superfamily endonuclease
VKYTDGRGPLPPDGIHTRPWKGPSEFARRNPRTPNVLYRFYSGDGQLLYIGITQDAEYRWRCHARDAAWWHLQARITVERYRTRAEAEDAEREAIKTERPLYNVAHAGSNSVGLHLAARLPERRAAAPRYAPEPRAPSPPPWKPNDEQAEALATVKETATAGQGSLAEQRTALRRAIAHAWDLGIPGKVMAAYASRTKRRQLCQ